MKILSHKHYLPFFFFPEETVYFPALFMLYEEFERIQTLLLGLCFEHRVNNSVRSDVHTTGEMLQEEAVITAVQKMAKSIFSGSSEIQKEKKKNCSALEQTQNV